MSAAKSAVESLVTSSTPATALTTVWPEETAAPTTKPYVKVSNNVLSATNISSFLFIAFE